MKRPGLSPGCQAFVRVPVPLSASFPILQTSDQMVSKNPTGTDSLRFCEFTYLFVTEFVGKFGKCLPSMWCEEKGGWLSAVGSALFPRKARSLESGWEHPASRRECHFRYESSQASSDLLWE